MLCIVYEPTLKEDSFFRSEMVSDMEEFKSCSNVIVDNCWNSVLNNVKDNVFTRNVSKGIS